MPRTMMRQLTRRARDADFTWRYLLNFRPTLTYKLGGGRPEGEAAAVLADLNRNGVAITSAERLLGDSACYRELASAVDVLERSQADVLEARRRGGAAAEKNFNHELLGPSPEFDPDSVYARFALQHPILRIANEYFGMLTQLRYYNVWHTFVTRAQPRQSQLWHQDREDRQILKVFVYLSDIDQGGGPFTYAPGTHFKGRVRQQPAYVLEDGVKRSDDGQMGQVVPPECWISGTGPRGTIVFADTRGFHKGGLARERDRIMYLCKFTSQAGGGRGFLSRHSQGAMPRDSAQAFALSWLDRRGRPVAGAGLMQG